VGRTQELVYSLNRMFDAGDIPRIPVFVDSPLAINATEIFSAHPECFDKETLEFIRNSPHHAALGHDMITYTRSVEQSKSINYTDGPVVIISASGMAETGRILHHLKNNITRPENTVLIVSWQAPHTLGRRLADQEKQVRIFGETYNRRCEVVTINGFSAHGGQSMLVEYARAVQDTVKDIFLVHGETRGAEPLMEKLDQAGMEPVFFPEPHSSFNI
ncbi:MAG: MBL fold metallo-hydrolase, partial [Gammaproteobacteria bacterium]|nr:MBL fold metallo-hydrolase [candidate division Zixibacteria bacterium]NIR95167.1 MBL fold metallo-hydrolase [Gammaproteobacteria bacterium]NIT61592.1 MBL fold metallo-hydrolase [Fodinibius sp.]NIS48992.1 MBL fold metallo-hydrolase [candidate division Zixibacteria bacterium]NIU17077.1 MBL fold metallo-hydrolase [candidate division Zixibacteria bacterium]